MKPFSAPTCHDVSRPWRRLASSCLLALISLAARAAPNPSDSPALQPTHEIILIMGAPGEESYQRTFAEAAGAWREAASSAGAKLTIVGQDHPAEAAPEPASAAENTDRERLRGLLSNLDDAAPFPAWIIYVGHGTFDRKEAWLNLRGPDVSATELSQWLSPLTARTLVFIHGGSASGPFLPLLSGPNRIVITATRSGEEVNYARLGERFARAVASRAADIDQDGTTSVLEAYLHATKEVQAVYTEANRMTTEHALLDDNGDKLGTPSEWFQGVRVVKRPDNKSNAPDGLRARQVALLEPSDAALLTPEDRRQRDGLEQELEALRARRAALGETAYLREIERVLRRLAHLYRQDD